MAPYVTSSLSPSMNIFYSFPSIYSILFLILFIFGIIVFFCFLWRCNILVPYILHFLIVHFISLPTFPSFYGLYSLLLFFLIVINLILNHIICLIETSLSVMFLLMDFNKNILVIFLHDQWCVFFFIFFKQLHYQIDRYYFAMMKIR